MDQPRWLEHAWRELGETERAGTTDNPRILALFRDAGHAEVVRDEVAWCAAFAGACLERAGIGWTRSLLARSYLRWGSPLDSGRLGAIAVLSRGADPALGHVGFLIGETDDALILLGGNQSNAVGVAPFPRSRLLGLRWPATGTRANDGAAEPREAEFARALAHVLEMEGGYSEDPHDPGGPTNFGITLATFASWKGAVLDAQSAARLKQELRAIAPETVRAIYFSRYWTPAGCAAHPPALALIHFDAAVNHGVGGAIRMLQSVVGVTPDGEIGPETRAAAARADVDAALAGYAAARRARYKALPHFWRFGRGWLARVDRTLERARALAAAAPVTTISQGETDMKPESMEPADAKWWGSSKTVWGAVITALAAVLPALGPAVGIDITGDLVTELGAQLAATIQAVVALAGTIVAIYGRTRATQPLARRPVSLKL